MIKLSIIHNLQQITARLQIKWLHKYVGLYKTNKGFGIINV